MYKEEIFPSACNKECRFCFGEETIYSPLITPCECKGTQAYIHTSCLYNWQKQQVNKPWSSRFCSVCLHPYTIPKGTFIFQNFRMRFTDFRAFPTYIKLIFAAFTLTQLRVFYDISLHLGSLCFFSILGIFFSLLLCYSTIKRQLSVNIQIDSS